MWIMQVGIDPATTTTFTATITGLVDLEIVSALGLFTFLVSLVVIGIRKVEIKS